MKLVKLSLAAIVAAGAMTTFASATPLEEAIKGVEVSGMARYRFYHQSDKVVNKDDGGHQRNRFSGELNVVSPVADNLKFGITLGTDNNDYAANSASDAGDVYVDKFWFQYAVNGLTLKMGKIEVPTPWTQAGFAGTRGNGILGLYSGVENWTFAAAYYNQVNGLNDANILADFSSYDAKPTKDPVTGDITGGGLNAGQEDLMALAAIGSVGPVNLQVWAARMEHVIDYTVFGEAAFAMNGFNLKGQINYLKLGDGWLFGDPNNPLAPGVKYDKLLADDAGIFFGFLGGYKNDQFFVNLGYTKNDDDQPLYALDGDNDGFIQFGKQLYYKTVNNPDTQVFFGNAGFNYNKFGAAIGYGYADSKGYYGDMDEFYGQVSYKVAKNFGLELYYSVLGADDKSIENDELRFQAIYNF